MTNANLSTWELFLAEIDRNIKPKKKEISDQLSFLEDKIKKVCKSCENNQKDVFFIEKRLEAIITVRYNASYEQAINEYLHPHVDFKQANIRAELFHFGTIFEGLIEIFLLILYCDKKITEKDLKDFLKESPKELEFLKSVEKFSIRECRLTKQKKTPFTFVQSIKLLKQWNNIKNSNDTGLSEILKSIDELRKERNKIHIDNMIKIKKICSMKNIISQIRKQYNDFIKKIKEV